MPIDICKGYASYAANHHSTTNPQSQSHVMNVLSLIPPIIMCASSVGANRNGGRTGLPKSVRQPVQRISKMEAPPNNLRAYSRRGVHQLRCEGSQRRGTPRHTQAVHAWGCFDRMLIWILECGQNQGTARYDLILSLTSSSLCIFLASLLRLFLLIFYF